MTTVLRRTTEAFQRPSQSNAKGSMTFDIPEKSVFARQNVTPSLSELLANLRKQLQK